MAEVIIDTNVAVVANRQSPKVAQECIDACAEFLAVARAEHVILLDQDDEIRAEYARALSMGRPYQLGAQFLVHVLQHQHGARHVRLVHLPKDAAGMFADFPTVAALAKFDLSDRKFAALGRRAGVPVTNATDSDWAAHLPALNANGIAVNFLCGCDKTKWFAA